MTDILNKKLILNKGCRFKETTDAAQILIPEGMLKLNPVGCEILRHCDGVKTTAEILQFLKTHYVSASPEQIEIESLKFIQRLLEKRILLAQ